MMTSTSNGANFECCMCGDSGLSYELFRCKVCRFRSQHRYCSNLYPSAESYRVCNWCLIQKEESAAGTSNSSDSSSPYKAEQDLKLAKKKGLADDRQYKMPSPRAAASKSLRPVSPIKKHPRPSPETASPPSSRKRVVAAKSGGEGAANGSATPVKRHVFRNKVRRYKLLEEVSS